MPKLKGSKDVILKNFAKEFACFKEDGDVLLCTVCSTTVSADRRSSVMQHLQTAKHLRQSQKNVPSRTTPTSTQLFLSEAIGKNKEFCMDLAGMLVSADIPAAKLDNPSVREFFSKYCKHELPSESTIRKNYIPKLYEEQMEEMRRELKNEYLWVAVDETTDSCGRIVTNVFAGEMKFCFQLIYSKCLNSK
jgi:hypothetical protein